MSVALTAFIETAITVGIFAALFIFMMGVAALVVSLRPERPRYDVPGRDPWDPQSYVEARRERGEGGR